MIDDPIVAEVRRVREELAKEFNFDIHRIFEDLRKKESKLGDRLVRLPKKTSMMAEQKDNDK